MAVYKAVRQHTRKKYNSKYYKTTRAKILAVQRMIIRRGKGCVKEKARQLLQRAVATGKITKPAICSDCENEFPKKRIHGHHRDYNKPYDVQWLCRECHDKL
jgi:hypothetical protein|tara:strand:- start:1509 stop:1814 length:306 start_codon:yes stop_codon:yes gene_type:complete